MHLLPADYAILGLALALAVLGLFRGLSGALAFYAAVAAAAAAAVFSWRFSSGLVSADWARGAIVIVVAVVAFGLVRLVVKKTVNKLLSQPSDAIFGFVCGALTAALVVVAWAWSGLMLKYSALASEVARHVR